MEEEQCMKSDLTILRCPEDKYCCGTLSYRYCCSTPSNFDEDKYLKIANDFLDRSGVNNLGQIYNTQFIYGICIMVIMVVVATAVTCYYWKQCPWYKRRGGNQTYSAVQRPAASNEAGTTQEYPLQPTLPPQQQPYSTQQQPYSPQQQPYPPQQYPPQQQPYPPQQQQYPPQQQQYSPQQPQYPPHQQPYPSQQQPYPPQQQPYPSQQQPYPPQQGTPLGFQQQMQKPTQYLVNDPPPPYPTDPPPYAGDKASAPQL